MKKKLQIEGAIFDLDGTLLDSMCVWDALDARYLRSVGIEPTVDLESELRSASLRRAAELFKLNYGLPETVEEIMEGINRLVEDMYFNVVQPKTGVADFLKYLDDIGVKMCVATATDRYQVDAALERCGIRKYFGEIFTCTEMGCGKDNPLIFETALRFLGTDRSRTFVFEDALYAMETAKSVGLKVAAVRDKSAEPEENSIIDAADIYLQDYVNAPEKFERL